MVHGGHALARMPDGRVALVRGGIPGETVTAELTNQKGVLLGHVLDIKNSSADRVVPPVHPGLDLGFVSYERQLVLKRQVVQDALLRALKREVLVEAVAPSPEVWAYRHVVQPVLSAEGGLGYRVPDSHDVVLMDVDVVAHASINALWQQWRALNAPKGIRELVFRSNDQGEVLLSLVASASAKQYLDFAHALIQAGVKGVSYAKFDPRGRFRSGSERLAGARTIMQRYGRFAITVSATNFAQPNPSAASRLYERIEALGFSGHQALDLYAGSGVIGMHLANAFERVSVLDIDRGSIQRGQQDAKRLGIDNVTFVKADAKQVRISDTTELIAVDPPRAGLNKDVRALISGSRAKHLVYVSCDVATWARDVAAFEQQGWQLQLCEPFDFYPHTHHIEMLSVLSR